MIIIKKTNKPKTKTQKQGGSDPGTLDFNVEFITSTV